MLDLRVGSEFLKLATALLRIKARRLLPQPLPAAAGAEGGPAGRARGPAPDYARYRDAARKLRESLEARRAVWVRQPALGFVEGEAANGDSASAEPETLLQVDLFAVVEAFRRVVVRARARPQVPIPERRISMAVLIGRIEAAVPPGVEHDFEGTPLRGHRGQRGPGNPGRGVPGDPGTGAPPPHFGGPGRELRSDPDRRAGGRLRICR